LTSPQLSHTWKLQWCPQHSEKLVHATPSDAHVTEGMHVLVCLSHVPWQQSTSEPQPPPSPWQPQVPATWSQSSLQQSVLTWQASPSCAQMAPLDELELEELEELDELDELDAADELESAPPAPDELAALEALEALEAMLEELDEVTPDDDEDVAPDEPLEADPVVDVSSDDDEPELATLLESDSPPAPAAAPELPPLPGPVPVPCLLEPHAAAQAARRTSSDASRWSARAPLARRSPCMPVRYPIARATTTRNRRRSPCCPTPPRRETCRVFDASTLRRFHASTRRGRARHAGASGSRGARARGSMGGRTSRRAATMATPSAMSTAAPAVRGATGWPSCTHASRLAMTGCA
jgi:hypothetical protein